MPYAVTPAGLPCCGRCSPCASPPKTLHPIPIRHSSHSHPAPRTPTSNLPFPVPPTPVPSPPIRPLSPHPHQVPVPAAPGVPARHAAARAGAPAGARGGGGHRPGGGPGGQGADGRAQPQAPAAVGGAAAGHHAGSAGAYLRLVGWSKLLPQNAGLVAKAWGRALLPCLDRFLSYLAPRLPCNPDNQSAGDGP